MGQIILPGGDKQFNILIFLQLLLLNHLSRVRLFMTTWTAAHQAPLSMGFSRQEYWSGMPLSVTIFFLVKNDRLKKKKKE